MSYGLVSYGPTVLCPMQTVGHKLKPGLHSMQKAQFNTKCKIGFIFHF